VPPTFRHREGEPYKCICDLDSPRFNVIEFVMQQLWAAHPHIASGMVHFSFPDRLQQFA
jgi:hypothetical protein